MNLASASLSVDIGRWLDAIASTADLVENPSLLSKNSDLSVRTGSRVVENRTNVPAGEGSRHWWWCDRGRNTVAESRSAEGQCTGQSSGGCQGCWAHRISDSDDGRVKRIVDDCGRLRNHTGGRRKQCHNGHESRRVFHFEGFWGSG